MILRVRQITYQAEKINSYELTDPGGKELPPFTAGAHIDFHFRDGSVRQYSLCNDPAERHRYLISILREEHGRAARRRCTSACTCSAWFRWVVPATTFRWSGTPGERCCSREESASRR